MKRFRKLLSLVLTVIMVLAMAVPSFAATIIIDDENNTDATYVAYKLLTATETTVEEEVDGELKDVTYYAYSVNDKYSGVLETVTGKTNSGEIVEYIRGLKDSAEAIRAFADSVFSNLGVLEEDYTATNGQFADVDPGYYLIVETKAGDSDDAVSLVMLDTAGKTGIIEVSTKEDVPEVEKKIEGNQDVADYAVGDVIEFQLIGTLPDNLDDYKEYSYEFIDTLSEGLTYDWTDKNDEGVDATEATTVTINGSNDVTDYFTIDEEDGKLTISIDDIKDIPDISSSDKIVVTYYAQLNEKALTNHLATNTVKIVFSNNPYGEGTGETTSTTVEVYTFDFIVNKVNEANEALQGAGFSLHKYNTETETYELVSKIDPGTTTTFEFSGLDAGKYMLVEDTAPTGYNKIDNIYFEIVPDYALDEDANSYILNSLTVKVTDEEGNELTGDDKPQISADKSNFTLTTNVVNNTGTELPSTGGIGTTVFYAAGIVLMAGAVFFVVRRKRA